MTKEQKDFCKRHGLTEDQFFGRREYPGDLYLGGLTSIPEGFNPTVGSYLDLSGLTSIPDGFNPTVGGDLYLNGLTSKHTPLSNRLLFWKDGKYVLADGIFTEVISKKGRVYEVRDIGSGKTYYLVTNGESLHAHGETLEQAKADLRFKRLAEKFKSEPIKPSQIITVDMFRIITGACQTGCEQWMRQNGVKVTKMRADKLLGLLQKTNVYGAQKFAGLMEAQ